MRDFGLLVLGFGIGFLASELLQRLGDADGSADSVADDVANKLMAMEQEFGHASNGTMTSRSGRSLASN